jgi:mannitol/fructose-specific phosphotransferase system IIA component
VAVSPEHILLNAPVTTKDDVLELISQNLSALGLVSGDYLDALVSREEKVSTYLINGVAIPHGVNEAKQQVLNGCFYCPGAPRCRLE